MNFSRALELLKAGGKIKRHGWVGIPFISINKDKNEYFDNRGAYCVDCGGFFSDEDIFADDWEEVKNDS